MSRMLGAALVTISLAACVTLRADHVITGAARPPHAGEVRILMEGAPVPGDCDEIAIVSATGVEWKATLPAVLSALQKEAAAVGANAVVRVRYDRGSSSATATGVAVWLR